MSSHLIEQHVAVHAVGGIEQDEHLRLVVVLAKRGEGALQRLGRGVIAQTCGPQHTAHVAAATFQSTALIKLLDDFRSHRGDVGLRVSLQHVLDRLLKFLVILLGEIGQCVDEHELGHDLGERILAHHLGIGLMYGRMVISEISAVGLLIHAFLVTVHVLEVLQIVGILHCHTVFGVGKVGEDAVTIRFGIGNLVVAHVHHVHTIIHVQAVSVVGISLQQLVVLVGCGVVVFHLVLEDGTHVVEAFLDDLMGRLYLFLGFGNLLEVVFLKVGILGTFEGFDIDLDRIAVLVDSHAVGQSQQGTVGFFVIEREGGLVAAAPVVLKLAATPLFLELGLTRILGGGVIEVP